jgi:hypothetical protein
LCSHAGERSEHTHNLRYRRGRVVPEGRANLGIDV